MVLILPYIQYFAIGIAIFQLVIKREFNRWTNYLILFLASLLIKQNLQWYSTGLHLIFVLTVYLVASGRPGPFTWKPLIWVGMISYPFYLIHQYLVYVVLDFFRGKGFGGQQSIAVILAICMHLAWAMHIWIEKPSRKVLLARYRGIGSVPFEKNQN